ncbi:MAG TPA: MFS transporter [Actinomycetes bacterium]|jgi:MFS family permease|nr:MFS transporter [Actinomycetes bacterium]
MSSQAAARVGYRQALASHQFRALFASQAVSVSGTSIAAVALTVLVYRRTASPLLASLAFSLGFVPYLLGGGLLSSVIDRVRPRRLVAACDLLSALLAAAMAWPAAPVTLLLGLLLVIGTLSSLSSGARVALARSTVSEEAYVPARSLMRIAAQIAQVGGNAGGGALLVVLTPSGAMLANAASFAFSAAAVRLAIADHPGAGQPSQARLLRDSLRGARTIFAYAELRRLLLFGWLAPMFAVAPEALAAPYVAAHHGSPILIGWWLVALPVGLIAGDIAGVRLLTPRQQRRLVAPAAAASFVPYLAFAFGPTVPIALGLLVVSGACGLYVLGLDARTRAAVPPRLFARAMTLNTAGLMTLQGVGFTLAGAIAQAVGPAIAIVIAGGLGLGATIALLRSDLSPAARRRGGKQGADHRGEDGRGGGDRGGDGVAAADAG